MERELRNQSQALLNKICHYFSTKISIFTIFPSTYKYLPWDQQVGYSLSESQLISSVPRYHCYSTSSLVCPMKQVARLSLYDHNCNGMKGNGRLESDWDSVQGLHSQKRHRLDASCGFYQPDAICQQVVSSLLTLSSCIKSVNIRLAAT